MAEVRCCENPVPAPGRAGWFRRGGWLFLALPLWALAYSVIQRLAGWVAFHLFGLAPGSHLGEAVAFFLYDVPKVLLLLALIVFVVTFLQTFVSPSRVRDALSRRNAGLGNAMASLFGIVTPFCSCSAVPLFIGFLRAGVPLGVTFSFLVAAPMVNEVALGMLFAMFGWKIALLYAGTGVAIAFSAGLILGRLRMERHLEGWVQDALGAPALGESGEERLTLSSRIDQAVQGVRDIVGKVWPYILAGISVGAFIHGFVPEAFMAGLLGKQAWYSVPLAVLIGVPLYSNAAGVMPIVEALLGKGAALGSTLAFMMAVIGLSLPEIVILRRVMRPRLIGAFVAVVALGIVLVGYLFNAIL
ncbi:permease [Mesoterricola silvestris]|uniref:Permease n=1 Tax=Mesoterricola silvestris TaxID=2927979 RepID=A0AA48K9C0_9BACT|nr:permease [Mesoterricola silvestris]BDU72172.1 permease [Mesoterricola silvestris]